MGLIPKGKKTVLVTGGSGFLGGWCLVELLERGYKVRATVRDASRENEVRAMVSSKTSPEDRLSISVADLSDDAGWSDAVAGCDYVLHVASPFPPSQPDDPDELIVPAREGTLRVLRAALDSGVERVVLTSSVAAVRNTGGPPRSGPFTEEDWTDADNLDLTPYTRSKTLAEQAAWNFVREAGKPKFLTVINPGAIIGPVLGEDRSYSLQAIERMLTGMPGLPRLGFSFVDVRDVAAMEVTAMTSPAAAGERFIAAGPFYWMSDIAEIMRERLGDAASKVPKRKIPSFVVRAMARFDPGLRSVVGELGVRSDYSTAKAQARLGWAPRPIEQSVADCAESLRRHSASEPATA